MGIVRAVFTASASFDIPAGVKSMRVFGRFAAAGGSGGGAGGAGSNAGGGGAGGKGGGGGGPGSSAQMYGPYLVDTVPGELCDVVIGAGGTGGAGGVAGGSAAAAGASGGFSEVKLGTGPIRKRLRFAVLSGTSGATNGGVGVAGVGASGATGGVPAERRGPSRANTALSPLGAPRLPLSAARVVMAARGVRQPMALTAQAPPIATPMLSHAA